MSKALTLVAGTSFNRAEQILSDAFDYGDGRLTRKRVAIAMNLIAMARADDGIGLKHLWTNNMIDDNGKANVINGMKEMPTADADDAVNDIWDHMDDVHKQMHLNNHPESRHHVREQHNEEALEQHAETEVEDHAKQEEEHHHLRQSHKRRNRRRVKEEAAKGTEEEGDDGWWNQMSMTEQRKYLRLHPKSKKARRFRIGIRNIAMKATRHIHHEVRKMGHDYRNGMEGIRQLRKGRKMTDEQKEGLKRTAKRVAVLLIGALAVSAMFTPLGPIALEVGDKYLDSLNNRTRELATEHERQREKEEDARERRNGNNENSNQETTVGQAEPADTSESGTNLHAHLKSGKREQHKKDEMELAWMQRDMTDWIMAQDTEELVEEITGKSK